MIPVQRRSISHFDNEMVMNYRSIIVFEQSGSCFVVISCWRKWNERWFHWLFRSIEKIEGVSWVQHGKKTIQTILDLKECGQSLTCSEHSNAQNCALYRRTHNLSHKATFQCISHFDFYLTECTSSYSVQTILAQVDAQHYNQALDYEPMIRIRHIILEQNFDMKTVSSFLSRTLTNKPFHSTKPFEPTNCHIHSQPREQRVALLTVSIVWHDHCTVTETNAKSDISGSPTTSLQLTSLLRMQTFLLYFSLTSCTTLRKHNWSYADVHNTNSTTNKRKPGVRTVLYRRRSFKSFSHWKKNLFILFLFPPLSHSSSSCTPVRVPFHSAFFFFLPLQSTSPLAITFILVWNSYRRTKTNDNNKHFIHQDLSGSSCKRLSTTLRHSPVTTMTSFISPLRFRHVDSNTNPSRHLDSRQRTDALHSN